MGSLAIHRTERQLAVRLIQAHTRIRELERAVAAGRLGCMVCPHCNGDGILQEDDDGICPGCDGDGYISPTRVCQSLATADDDVSLWDVMVAGWLTDQERQLLTA